MNNIASREPHALILPDTIPYDQFIEVGRQLSIKQRNVNWLIGDWVAHAQQNFPEQLSLALTEITNDPKEAKSLARVARAFPPPIRDLTLSHAHHALVADMAPDEALTMINRAKKEGWSIKKMRSEATVRKHQIAQTTIWKDDDIDYAEQMTIIRAWNRAQPSVRKETLPLIINANLGIIEA